MYLTAALRGRNHMHQRRQDMIAPDTIYCGKREVVIAEVGGMTHIYPGKYLVQPDGNAAYDAEGADSAAEMDGLIAYYRDMFPNVNVVML